MAWVAINPKQRALIPSIKETAFNIEITPPNRPAYPIEKESELIRITTTGLKQPAALESSFIS